MTKPRTIPPLLCTLVLALCAPATAMQVDTPEAGTIPIPSANLEIAYYKPTGTSTQTLMELAGELFGDMVLVQRPSVLGRDGGQEWVLHFLKVQDTILIRDTAEQALKIRAELERLEKSLGAGSHGGGAGDAANAKLVDWQYEPRHVSAATLEIALSRFHRSFLVQPPEGMSGQARQAQTIRSLPDRNLLLVHETPEQIETIKAFVAGIDKPAPQVTITYFVITGYSDPSVQDGRNVPAELVENLKRLVPAESYRLELTGVLRSSVSGKMTVEDDLRHMQMLLEPASFDARDGNLALRTCRFEYQNRSFSTSATLRRGEYTVLGAAGEDPVFLVLRLSAADPG